MKRSRRLVLPALVAALFLGLGLVLVANPVARWQTRRLLTGIPGVDGNFQEATLSLFPPTYRVEGLTVLLEDRRSGEPLLEADGLSVRLLLAPLLRGRLVVEAVADRPRVVLEQPGPGPTRHLPEPADFPLAVLVRSLTIEGGAVRYVWVHEKNTPHLLIHGIEATLENVPARPGLAEGPMKLEGHASLGKSGQMSVKVEAPSFEQPLSFDGEARVTGFDVSEMNLLIDDQTGLTLKPGRFSMTMSFRSDEGQVSGEIAPHLEDSGITTSGGSILDGLKAELARVNLHLAAPASGTSRSGSIAVHDDVSQPERQLLPTLEKVVEHGFLLGVQEGLKRVQGGGATQGEASVDRKPTKLSKPRVQ